MKENLGSKALETLQECSYSILSKFRKVRQPDKAQLKTRIIIIFLIKEGYYASSKNILPSFFSLWPLKYSVESLTSVI